MWSKVQEPSGDPFKPGGLNREVPSLDLHIGKLGTMAQHIANQLALMPLHA
jgi:hypothetical protein